MGAKNYNSIYVCVKINKRGIWFIDIFLLMESRSYNFSTAKKKSTQMKQEVI